MVLLPEPAAGGQLSLQELRAMAARQQHQIEAHQQLLVAKEQRLRFLQQRPPSASQPQQEAALRQLRERVELQELKLRRLRALRGQVEQHRSNNSNLGAELESVRALFSEKEKELCLAVGKVEELTRQLEEVRRATHPTLHPPPPSPAAIEFQKLKRELTYRSQLNEQQNARIAEQREALARRQAEMSRVDGRIAELQRRLQRKRDLNRSLSAQLHATPHPRATPNIAAVEPLKRPPPPPAPATLLDINKNQGLEEFGPSKKDPKYQTLPYNTKFPHQDPIKPDEKPKVNGGPPPYPEPPSVHSPHSKVPVTTSHSAPLSPQPFVSGSTNGRIPPPQRVPTSNGVSVTTTANSSPPASKSVGPPVNSRPKTPVTSHTAVLPPTVMTAAATTPRPGGLPTPQRPLPAPSYSYARARSNELAGKPVVPPKPSPAKPVLPPRQQSPPKPPDTVDHAISVLRGDGHKLVGEISPPSALHRVAPSLHNSSRSTLSNQKPSEATTSNGDSPADTTPSNSRLPTLAASTHQHASNVHISLNRRIGMPPASFFPENQPPPSDLNGIDPKRRVPPFAPSSESQPQSQSQNNSPENSASESDTSKSTTEPSPPKTKESLSSPNSSSSSLSADEEAGKGGRRRRRVSFDPLALLLDAALEGELELVKKTAREVPNPSASNDEGITALHNAICAGHLDIVRFLVEFGCDVNAQDSDGWTPLHCAASCNNVCMVRYLVERGACIFAATLSDRETAAEKCEEDEDGFDSCSEYLYGMQEKLGIARGGSVFSVFEYEGSRGDELSFAAGEQLTVLRRGDHLEREWWWCRKGDREGYVPRNLLGLCPRVTVKKDQQQLQEET